MSLIDQGEGRTVSLYFNVKLTPPADGPVGETDGASQIVEDLQIAGSEALKKVVEGQGYNVEISTAYFIF